MPTRANTGKVRPRTALFASPWCSARAVRRGAARLFVAMAATALIAGCGGDDNENTEVGGNTTHARLTANLTGSIQDTNGTPIEGATVGVAGRTTSTNALGQWLLTNVPVVNVQNNSDTPCAGTGGESNAGTLGGCVGVPLLVTVTAEGHLGGHGYVLPDGQILTSEKAAEAVAAGNGGDGGQGSDANGGNGG
ncbi:MAG: hypothetical protein L0H83_14905, partial [Salinisphaera sp.]|nr:hypothetical protein [Salinisphaera sp.]